MIVMGLLDRVCVFRMIRLVWFLLWWLMIVISYLLFFVVFGVWGMKIGFLGEECGLV